MDMVITSNHLTTLFEARVWLPGLTPTGATNVKIHHVMISGGSSAAMEICAGHIE
jgi:hypothetical protein